MILDYVKPVIPKDELIELYEVFKLCKKKRVVHERNEPWSFNSKLKPSEVKKDCLIKEDYDYSKWLKFNFKYPLSSFRYENSIKKNYRIREYSKIMDILKESSQYSGYNYYEKILLGTSNRILRRSEEKLY